MHIYRIERGLAAAHHRATAGCSILAPSLFFFFFLEFRAGNSLCSVSIHAFYLQENREILKKKRRRAEKFSKCSQERIAENFVGVLVLKDQKGDMYACMKQLTNRQMHA